MEKKTLGIFLSVTRLDRLYEKLKPIAALLACLSFMCLFSCSKTDRMVGKWQWENGGTSHFLENGTYVSSEGWTGSWEITRNHLTIKAFGYTWAYEVQELSHNKLVLKDLAKDKVNTCIRIEQVSRLFVGGAVTIPERTHSVNAILQTVATLLTSLGNAMLKLSLGSYRRVLV